MSMHAFVAMPFGTKPGFDGMPIDFNRIYAEYLRPALEAAGFEVFRADEELRAGDIRADMFQELLIADLVLADLSIDNPNVWYELGVRHALRARGVLVVQGDRPYQPFDIYTDRKLRYHVRGGAPDPDHLEADRRALTEMARATVEAWHGRKVSPVYALLDHLEEPQWRALLSQEASEFRDAYQRWSRRMEAARLANRPGNILALADETPTYALRLEAKRMAGSTLMQLRQHGFALEQFEAALAIDPTDLPSRRRKGICLGRLGRHAEALVWVRAILDDHPDDPESRALLGRIVKDAWIARWHDAPGGDLRAAARDEDAALEEAIDPYLAAFERDPTHFYSGINALTLRYLACDLSGTPPDAPALRELEGGVRWACRSALAKNPKDFWARASLAQLELLSGAPETAIAAFKSALVAADRDWFALDSSRQTGVLLRELGFRVDLVETIMRLFDREIARVAPPWAPPRVFLFSGHMIDAPGRRPERFPQTRVPEARAAIEAALDRLGADRDDLAICGGACGGDLLFAEAALARGLKLEIMLAYQEPEFLKRSVSFAGGEWSEHYYRLKGNPAARIFEMPDELGPGGAQENAYERCNRWMLYSALAHGEDRVRFVCLWNGEAGDGPGGTRHMYDEVNRRTGQVTWLDTRTLWPNG